jgi:hypothetical protein
MQELKQFRTLNSKRFDSGDGKNTSEIHVGHIHYDNKLGLGDGVKGLREIDFALSWDETKRGYTMLYHSFNPFFPEFSDGTAEFRDLFEGKDQTVRYKAQVQNVVKGVLIDKDDTNPGFDDNVDNKGVLYKDAFGTDRDYILYNTRSSMVKVATVNNPNEQTSDVKFTWEVQLPEADVFRVDKPIDAEEMTTKGTKTNTEDGVLVGYKLDLTRGKRFNTPKLTAIGNSKLDGKEWFTYLKGYKAWDSEGNTINIEAKLYTGADGKRYLEKTIPVEFLQSAKGRVFTDTTTTYYPSQDAYGYYNPGAGGGTWDVTRDATSASTFSDVATTMHSGTGKNGANSGYIISRSFMFFDTSSIGTDTIDSADLNVYVTAKENADNDGLDYISVVLCDTTNSIPVADDFDQFVGLPSIITEGNDSGDRKDIGIISVSSMLTFALNSTGIGHIDTNGLTKLGLSEGHDIQDISFVGGGSDDNMIIYSSSEETATAQIPTLVVVHSVAGQITTVSDTFSISESVLIDMTNESSDTISVAESMSALRGLLTSVSDVLNITESVTALRNRIVSVSDTLGITEAITVIAKVVINVSDSIGLTDAITTVKRSFINVSDNINLTEFYSAITNLQYIKPKILKIKNTIKPKITK